MADLRRLARGLVRQDHQAAVAKAVYAISIETDLVQLIAVGVPPADPTGARRAGADIALAGVSGARRKHHARVHRCH